MRQLLFRSACPWTSETILLASGRSLLKRIYCVKVVISNVSGIFFLCISSFLLNFLKLYQESLSSFSLTNFFGDKIFNWCWTSIILQGQVIFSSLLAPGQLDFCNISTALKFKLRRKSHIPVVPIRILIRTAVLPIRGVIRTIVVWIRILIGTVVRIDPADIY